MFSTMLYKPKITLYVYMFIHLSCSSKMNALYAAIVNFMLHYHYFMKVYMGVMAKLVTCFTASLYASECPTWFTPREI
jgi:hypothetical protein